LVVLLATASLANVVFNAWLGAEVVHSGLKPGVITTHMALAFLLICLLTTLIRLTGPERAPLVLGPESRRIGIVSWVFLLCLLAEGILGSQVREETDLLAKAAGELPREAWTAHLEQTLIYLVHRSFSWSLLLASTLLLFWVQCSRIPALLRPRILFGGVLAMMAMGVILAHVAIFRVVQVLHVGMTAVLLAVAWGWLLELLPAPRVAKPSANA
jgi:cytochrome c oxidase assembly protein subunit 15